MLLRNGDKKDSKSSICVGKNNLIKQSSTKCLNNRSLIVKKQPTENIHQESNAEANTDSIRDLIHSNPNTEDANIEYVESIPPQRYTQPYSTKGIKPDVSCSIPPFCYQQYEQIITSSSSSFLSQNIVPSTSLISPVPNQIPHIVYTHPLPLQNFNRNSMLPLQFNVSQSHTVLSSSMSASENSIKHFPNNSSSNSSIILSSDEVSKLSDRSVNNSLSRPYDNNSNNNLSNYIPSPFTSNLSYSSISLPQSNVLLEAPMRNNPSFSSLQNPLSTPNCNRPFTNQLSCPLPSTVSTNTSQSKLHLCNTDNLTPSRRMINVAEERVLIPSTGITNPIPNIMHITKKANCNPNIMRCTLNVMPANEDILSRTRLPLAILLHPFRDLPSLQVIRSKKIIRCRTLSCRAYINPFVSFTDQKRWKCNMCLRMNELSDDNLYNETNGEYFDTLKRFELRLPTVEYIAPKEYSLKGAQIPIYVFMIDISCNATHLLHCNTIGKILGTIEQLLDRLPGYQQIKISVIGYDSCIHLYSINTRGFQEIVIGDLSSPIEVPIMAGLVVDLQQQHEHVQELLSSLLENVNDCSHQHQASNSCLGSALLVAKQLFNGDGGRISIFNASCPTLGEGILIPREEVKGSNILPLFPDKEFYKSLSVEFAQAQIAVDLFQLGSLPCDLASLSIVTRYCGGSLFYYPNLSVGSERTATVVEVAQTESQRLLTDLHRYLTRKIGFEAVLRIRYSGGFNIVSSHGNFFARASDLLSMANVNPDSGVVIRLGIEENFCDSSVVYFQAALLYTSSVGERRIRVHTLCLPVSSQIDDVFRMADHQAVAGLLAKTVADRLQTGGNVIEAREGLLNAVIDPSVAFGKFCLSSSQRVTSLPFPYHLRMLPLYVWGLLQSKALRVVRNELDLSVSQLDSWRNMPLSYLSVTVYPNLYNLISVIDLNSRQRRIFQSLPEDADSVAEEHNSSATDCSSGSGSDSDLSCYNDRNSVRLEVHDEDEEDEFWYPQQVHLSTQSLCRGGVYLLDSAAGLLLLMGEDTPRAFLDLVFGVDSLSQVAANAVCELPDLNNACSAHLRVFIRELQVERPLGSSLFVVVNDRSLLMAAFKTHLLEDDQVDASYHRFLQHVQKKVNDS